MQPRSMLFKQLKVATYAVLGFFYTSLTQAALNIMSCYPIDAPVPADTPYPESLQVCLPYGSQSALQTEKVVVYAAPCTSRCLSCF